MARNHFLLSFCLLLAATAAGCTHEQLRKDSVNEATTVGDLQTQQVLNNLAMFVYDYNSMPYFAYPNQGSAVVTDQVNGAGSAAWGRPITTGATGATDQFTVKHFGDFLFNTLGLSAGAQRANTESFTLTPINDPRKLELMRCAYQLAVSNCGHGDPSRKCPDCQARFNTFYTGDPDPKIDGGHEIKDMNGGTITSECLKGPCWFCTGCEKDVPKHCPCLLVGHYCGVYVWVPPGGRDELTKLTLAILDYAVHDAPVRLTKDVTYYVDALGLPTTQKQGVAMVKATIGINEENNSLLNFEPKQERDLEQQLQERIRRLGALLEKADPKDTEQRKLINDDIEDAKQKLYFLDQQLRSTGLKEQFAPPGAAPAPPFSIIPGLQQSINANSSQITPPPQQ